MIDYRQSDLLSVTGKLDLSSATDSLALDWVPGATATSTFGGTYTIATYASLTGSGLLPTVYFDTEGASSGNPGAIGAAYIDSVDYDVGAGSNEIQVTLFAQLVGDLDLDGDSDFVDFTKAKGNFGTSGDWFDGDMDFDGDVDFVDFTAVKGAFGSTAGAAEVTPEPGTLALLAFGIGGLIAMKKKRSALKALVLVLVLGGLSAAALAAPVVNLSVEAGGGTWQVFAQIVGDGSEGISDFLLNVTADGDLAITGSLNESPQGFGFSVPGSKFMGWGFNELRSDGTVAGGSVNSLGAGQPSVYGSVNDPDKDWAVLQGIGQTAGSRMNFVTSTLVTWSAPVLLASGTYSGSVGTIYANGGLLGEPDTTAGWLLLKSGSEWTGPGNLMDPQAVNEGSKLVPEPATLALVGLGGLAMAFRRRRAA